MGPDKRAKNMRPKSTFQKAILPTAISLLWLVAGCSSLEEPFEANPAPELEVHPSGWAEPAGANFHGVFLAGKQWDLSSCKECHGQDYSGGIAQASCLTCHPGTPEDCTTCHGGRDNSTGAPPSDLSGNQDATARGVGAHSVHLSGKSFTNGFECQTCHVVPASFSSPAHIDAALPAEVTFTGPALNDGATPAWDGATTSCADSYCHGNWSLPKAESNFQGFYAEDNITGNNQSPDWTAPNSATCGTCHNLPPAGHLPVQLDQCANCHASVVDSEGQIIDKSKHVNGMVNVFQQEYPMF